MQAVSPLYHRHRFPVAISSHCVWLSHRFSLSLRDSAELMAKAGVQVSHEAIRSWCPKLGSLFADRLQRRRPPPADRWHCDEMQLKMNRTTQYLWRAVDRDGLVLGILVRSRRHTGAALALLRHVLGRAGCMPRGIVTDRLCSYAAALREPLPEVAHRQSKYLNNRAEHSHQPTRRRERAMQRCKSPRQARQFLEPFGVIGSHFRPRRHLLSAQASRAALSERFRAWREVTETG